MTWHATPKDDAWKQVTLASIEELGKRAWLHCRCGHEIVLEPRRLSEKHGLEMTTPLLTIGRALRCSRCGERKGQCWPEPYAITTKQHGTRPEETGE